MRQIFFEAFTTFSVVFVGLAGCLATGYLIGWLLIQMVNIWAIVFGMKKFLIEFIGWQYAQKKKEAIERTVREMTGEE